MADTRQYCSFFLDRHFFGVEVHTVQEIIRYQEMTRVPQASPVVRGLINLRGQIVTALDLRRRLELPDAPSDARPMNVVVRSEGGVVSLLVDAIGDVLEMDAATFERPPETLRGGVRDLIRGAFKLDSQLLLVLDTEKVVTLAV